MLPILNRQQSREVDRRALEAYGLSGLVLMENAGRGVADHLLRLGIRGPVLIACGRGNNGGDGFVTARHLEAHGIPVHVAAWGEAAAFQGDALRNLKILQAAQTPLEFWRDVPPANWWDRQKAADWIVDALLGTGSHGEPRAPLDGVIDCLNELHRPILAVDIPSGLDCDTGLAAIHTIRAAETCTFVTAKPGLVLPAAAPWVGKLNVLPIGVPRKLLSELPNTPST